MPARRYREVLNFTCCDSADVVPIDLYPVLASDVNNAGLPRDGYVIRSPFNLRELRDRGSLHPTRPIDAQGDPYGKD
jgi:hypothetical protein